MKRCKYPSCVDWKDHCTASLDGDMFQHGFMAVTKGRNLEGLIELSGSQHSFRLSKTQPHGLTISIRIPLEKG